MGTRFLVEYGLKSYLLFLLFHFHQLGVPTLFKEGKEIAYD